MALNVGIIDPQLEVVDLGFLKRQALLFDKIAVPHKRDARSKIPPQPETEETLNQIEPSHAAIDWLFNKSFSRIDFTNAEIEWLFSEGLLFVPPRPSVALLQHPEFSLLSSLYEIVKEAHEPYSLEYQRLLTTFDNIQNKRATNEDAQNLIIAEQLLLYFLELSGQEPSNRALVSGEDLQSAQKDSSHPTQARASTENRGQSWYELSLIKRNLNLRMLAFHFREIEGTDAAIVGSGTIGWSILRTSTSPRVIQLRKDLQEFAGKVSLLSEPKNDLVRIVLNELPEPDEGTSWEAILEFRKDPEARRKFQRLKNWINEVARAQLSVIEMEDKLKELLYEYEAHMKLHQMKFKKGIIEILVTTTAEILEDLLKLKLGKVAKIPFSLRQERLNLLEAEGKAPGREVAYIVEARSRFG